MDMKFYKCKHCGQMVAIVKETGVPIICCGEPMEEIMTRILQNQWLTYELMAELFGEDPIELPITEEEPWQQYSPRTI